MMVTLIDRADGSATVDWTTYGADLPSRPVFKDGKSFGAAGNFTMMRLETIAIPLSAFVGVNRSHVAQVAFDADLDNNTHVFIDNVHVVKR